MTISFRTTPTPGDGTTTTLAFTLPTGHTTHDCLIGYGTHKAYTVTVASGTLTTDYTPLAAGANGAVANGNGTGSNYTYAYYRIHDGSESDPTGTLSAAPSPRISGMLAASSNRVAASWTVTSCKGSDTTTTGTTFSATGDANLSFAVGDVLIVVTGTPDNAGTPSALALAASGITFSAVSELYNGTTAQGNDASISVYYATVTAGSGSTAPSATMTTSSGDSNGQTTFILLREPQAATGTVTGDATASGTVTGTKQQAEAYTGTVTGVAPATSGVLTSPDKGGKGSVTGVAPATSGTVTDTTQRRGTVTGLAPATSGVLTSPDKGGKGSVTGSATASGTVTGTKFEPSNDKTGTVTGVAPATSGTVAGAKGGKGAITGAAPATSGTATGAKGGAGAATGTATASGTVAGDKDTTGTATGSATVTGTATGTVAYPGNDDKTGTVTGTATATGTATGTKATSGTIAGDVTASGTASGTAYDPDRPVPVAPVRRGGSSYYPARPNITKPAAQPVRKSGRVSGAVITIAATRGTQGHSGTASGTCSVSGQARGVLGHSGRVRATSTTHAEARGTQTAPRDTQYLALYAEYRRAQDDADLMLML